MPKAPIISKSSFIKGKQCLKSLYLQKKYPEFQDPIPESQQAIFNQGSKVGELAQQLYPGGEMAAYDLPKGFMKSIKKTKELIRQGKAIIYEAGLMYQNTHCFVDILVKKNGKWFLFEVKSSTEVKDVHIYDAAFQYFVLSNLGFKIADVSIVYINNQYIREGDIDIKQLFSIESVLDRAIEIQPAVKNCLAKQVAALGELVIPNVDIGPHCSDPYDCNFMGYCRKHIPDYSVFDSFSGPYLSPPNPVYYKSIRDSFKDKVLYY